MRKFLFSFFFIVAPAVAANTLTIYNIPSPQKYNWQTPQTAYWSLHANLFNNLPSHDSEGNPIQNLRGRSLGHNYFKLSCINSSGQGTEVLNGMTMDSYPSDYRGEFHWIGGRGKYGMAFLFHNFTGRLDIRDESSESDRANVLRDLTARKNMAPYLMYDGNSGKPELREALSFIRFEISEKQCQDLMNYFEDFKRFGGNNRYGFMVHPLNENGELNIGPKLGSGCSEFVTSFIQKAGLMTPEFERKWKRNLHIPNALIGTPERAVRRRTMQSNTLPWGKRADAKHTLLSFWDPELMHEWALKMHERADGLTRKSVKEGKARGVLIKQQENPE